MGQKISQLGMAETRKTEAIYNSRMKRLGLKSRNVSMKHINCGCSADCGAFVVPLVLQDGYMVPMTLKQEQTENALDRTR
jgi:hypothetical protein